MAWKFAKRIDIKLENICSYWKKLKKKAQNDRSAFIDVKMKKNSDALRLAKALRLCVLPDSPGPTFIPCPTSIPDSKVCES